MYHFKSPTSSFHVSSFFFVSYYLQEKNISCPICEARFSFASNLHRHLKNIHKKVEICTVKGCDQQFANKRKLQIHMELEHGTFMEKEDLEFRNLEEFYNWKLIEEVQNFVCFTKRRGDIEMVGSTHQHYICYLSRRVEGKKKGTKNNLYCPARMLMRQSKETGSVRVTYFKTHSHTLTYSDTQSLPVPECQRHSIKKKLEAGLTVDNVYQQLKKEQQSQLAVSIATYNRLQRIDMTQISMIQRSMIRKGALEEQRIKNDNAVTVTVSGAMSDDIMQETVTVIIGDGEIVNDGEVQMDIESSDSFAKDLLLTVDASTAVSKATTFNVVKSIPDGLQESQEQDLEENVGKQSIPDATKHMPLCDDPLAIPLLINSLNAKSSEDVRQSIHVYDASSDQGSLPTPCSDTTIKVQDMFTQVMFLLQNDAIKKQFLPVVEGTMKELLNVCKESE